MVTKLHINLAQGVLEVEGEEAFVKSVYGDFKERLVERIGDLPDASTQSDSDQASGESDGLSPGKSRRARASGRRATRSPDGPKGKASDYKPTFNPDLDLSKLGAFYDPFEPKNHPEKILIFATFMRDQLKKAPCAADDIFSCYRAMKDRTKIPEAFVQALRDAQNKAGFIEYISPENIRITITGENRFTEMLKAAKAAASKEAAD